MDEWNHEYATVNGLRLHYVKEGSGGQLVVMLHGWPEFWYSWRHQIKALKEHYTVVAPDMRGFNESDKPEDISAYKQAEVATDIVALIEHLGFEKAIIVGHDWGGAIAWHLSLNYPELTEKFVVMNCPHPGIFVQNLKSNPGQFFKSFYMFFFQLPVIPELIINLDLKRFFTNAMRGMAYNKSNFSDEEMGRYVDAYKKPGAMTGGLNYYRANIRAVRELTKSMGRKVEAPTLVIWGENDQVLGKDMAIESGKYVNGRFLVHYIPECSHWVQNDCPEEVNRVLLDFLSDQ